MPRCNPFTRTITYMRSDFRHRHVGKNTEIAMRLSRAFFAGEALSGARGLPSLGQGSIRLATARCVTLGTYLAAANKALNIMLVVAMCVRGKTKTSKLDCRRCCMHEYVSCRRVRTYADADTLSQRRRAPWAEFQTELSGNYTRSRRADGKYNDSRDPPRPNAIRLSSKSATGNLDIVSNDFVSTRTRGNGFGLRRA